MSTQVYRRRMCVTVEEAGPIWTLILDRPDERNANRHA
jgi:hypothetical protein